MAFGEAKGTAQHAGMDGWIDIEIERHLWHTLTALLIAHTHTHACDNVSIKLLLPARAFHSTVVASFPPPSHAFLLLELYIHAVCPCDVRAYGLDRSMLPAGLSLLDRLHARTRSIPSLQGMERITAWLRVHASPRTKARSSMAISCRTTIAMADMHACV